MSTKIRKKESHNNTSKPKERRKQSVIPFIATKIPKGLTKEQVEEIQQSFHAIDTNGDGRLSKTEFTQAAYILGMNPTQKEIDSLWKEVDIDGDGFVSFEEYLNLMKSNYDIVDLEEERMKMAFATLDKNGDGVLSLNELRQALMYKNNDITIEEIDAFFKEVDSDGDGAINYKEFLDSAMCTKMFS